MTLAKAVSMKYNKTIEKCSNEEIYYALLDMTKQMAEDKVSNEGKKKLYYISAEFLIGKLLSNNLINLGIYDSVKSELEASGKNIGEIEEIELEPSLGNGGLGRLAACFVDSIATLGLNGDGVGLNYHYGLFKQVFDHNLQKETPNPWITPDSWLTKTDITYPVQFGGFTVQSRLYNIDVVGYNNRTTKLRLFDIETVDESIVGDTIDFNKDDIAKNLTLFLYPDDSDDKGRLLRVYQQYFMVSNAARLGLPVESFYRHFHIRLSRAKPHLTYQYILQGCGFSIIKCNLKRSAGRWGCYLNLPFTGSICLSNIFLFIPRGNYFDLPGGRSFSPQINGSLLL